MHVCFRGSTLLWSRPLSSSIAMAGLPPPPPANPGHKICCVDGVYIHVPEWVPDNPAFLLQSRCARINPKKLLLRWPLPKKEEKRSIVCTEFQCLHAECALFFTVDVVEDLRLKVHVTFGTEKFESYTMTAKHPHVDLSCPACTKHLSFTLVGRSGEESLAPFVPSSGWDLRCACMGCLWAGGDGKVDNYVHDALVLGHSLRTHC